MKAVTKKKAVKKEVSYLDQLTAPGRFFKRPDGWIKDNLLGLDWGPSSAERMDFKAAKEYCEKNGGRLPEVRELHSLVDYTKREPAINAAFSKDTKSSWYWSGTDVVEYDYSAWVVLFYRGRVDASGKDGFYYVRPCRASQ